MSDIEWPQLPLTEHRPAVMEALGEGPLLLEAEPGAGKSTLAPLWALEAAPSGEQVWLVQPRILAARGVARRLASLRGEAVGDTVGYQVPFDRKSSDRTRLLVLTPGILLQRLLDDPELAGVATVMLDEVHERSVDQDTAWVFLQELALVREELRLVLMSATPDPALREQVERRLFAPGRCFPVTVEHQPPQKTDRTLEAPVVRALASVPDWRERTALVFLPGWRAIADCARAIEQRWPGARVEQLHSRVDDREQERALDPASGPRVILATNIAETSLTIADVTLVIDSGQVRRARFERGTGIERLHTGRISRASAEQRRGRAGRVREGHCIRLWSAEEALVPVEPPAIRTADCAPLALRLAHWGAPVEELAWPEPPQPLALEQARRLLRQWGQIDEWGGLTRAGRQVAALGTHPRVAALLQAGLERPGAWNRELLLLALALHFDALALDGDWREAAERELARDSRWRAQAKRWQSVLGARARDRGELAPAVLAGVFRDRIGHRQSSGRYRLNSGISVAPTEPLQSDWAVFADLRARGKSQVGPGWALSLSETERRELSEPQVSLQHGKRGWTRLTRWRMGGEITAEDRQPLAGEALARALIDEIRAGGLSHYHWPEAAHNLWRRARLAREHGLLSLPRLGEADLLQHLEQWLAPFIDPSVRPDRLPWLEGLRFWLGHEAVRELDRLLPAHMTLPSGRRVAVDYSGDSPRIGGKLQEFFGCARLELGGGQLALQLELLAPNGASLAITDDLASFWRGAYREVRKQMRGRYPKHPWPEDPLAHPPTRLTKKRLGD